jgi:D-alanine-D-alanine ligase
MTRARAAGPRARERLVTRVKRLRVGVLYGGRSSEHEISVASAAAIFANLDRQRYEAVPIRIEKDGRWLLADRPPSAASAAEVIEQTRTDSRVRGGREVYLPPRPGEDTLMVVDRRKEGGNNQEPEVVGIVTGLSLDVLFPVLHGPYGEDGTIQGLLELANVPYVGCGVLSSAVGMDKAVMKVLFRARGLPVPDWITVTRRDWEAERGQMTDRIARELGYPLFIKPANLGSSVGISKVHHPGELDDAMELALGYDLKAVVEQAVPDAREIECAVLGNADPIASVPGEIVPSREFYDYEAKYLDSGSRTEVPAALDEATAETVRRLALDAFIAIDGAGLARVDFLLSRSSGQLFLNEINTLPGFTTISMYSKLWAASGLDYATLVDRLIALALDRHAEKQAIKTSVP